MTAALPRISNAIARATPYLVLGLFALVCIVGLPRVVALIGMHVPFDPNEGWNAYLTAAAMKGGPLYPDAHGYFVNNYPPLSFYLVGIVGRFVGDDIVAGRIISLLAFLCVASGLFQALRIMGCRAREAAIGAVLFLTWLMIGSDYVGMDDPQLLGHAIEVAGLLLVLRRTPNDIAAAVLFALAVFVKHNLVALPIALALWLILEDRARARRFIGAGFASTLLELVLFRIVYGSNLLSHLASSRAFSFALLASNLETWLVWGIIPLVIVGMLAVAYRADKFVVLCVLYAAIAMVVGVAFSSGAGVDANVFFDADIALSLGVGLALSRFSKDGAWKSSAIAACLLLPLGFGLYQASSGEDWRDPDFWLHPMANEAAAARVDIAFVKARPGAALCETLSFCYWADKERQIDVFNTGQQFETGARSDTALVRAIEAHEFSSLEFDTLEPFALGPRVKAAVAASYRVDHTDDTGVFLVPR